MCGTLVWLHTGWFQDRFSHECTCRRVLENERGTHFEQVWILGGGGREASVRSISREWIRKVEGRGALACVHSPFCYLFDAVCTHSTVHSTADSTPQSVARCSPWGKTGCHHFCNPC